MRLDNPIIIIIAGKGQQELSGEPSGREEGATFESRLDPPDNRHLRLLTALVPLVLPDVVPTRRSIHERKEK